MSYRFWPHVLSLHVTKEYMERFGDQIVSSTLVEETCKERTLIPVSDDKELFVIAGETREMAEPAGFQDADIPGLPPPLGGDRLKALAKSIELHGQINPIYVGRDNRLTYGGRSIRRACMLLRIKVWVEYIDSAEGPALARASEIQRKMTVIEKAVFILWFFENEPWLKQLTPFDRKGKKRDAFGRWLVKFRGWTEDTSGRQIDDYLMLARRLRRAKNRDAIVKKVEHCSTVKKALSALGLRKSTPDSSPEECMVGYLKKVIGLADSVTATNDEMRKLAEEAILHLRRKFAL